MRKFLAAFLLLFVMLGLSAPAAQAVEPVPAAVSNTVPAVDTDGDKSGGAVDPVEYVPVKRWGNMGFHSRLNWWNPVNAAASSGARGASGAIIAAGTGLWSTASDWTQSATSFDALSGPAGYQVDKLVGVMGNALKANPMVFVVIVAF